MSGNFASKSFSAPGCLITARNHIVATAARQEKVLLAFTSAKGIVMCIGGNTGFLAKTAYLYLRGLTSLPITLPGSIANANANCVQAQKLIDIR